MNMNNIALQKSRLQFITNQWSPRPIEEQVQKACEGGCGWVQLRLKDQDESQWLEVMRKIKPICHAYGAFLIINDHVEMALKGGADGVHVGKEDICPMKARQILGEHSIIGGTANTIEDIRALQGKKVDYIGLGPFRPTYTKQPLSPVIGIDGYKKLLLQMRKEHNPLPVIAVGGIGPQDLPALMETGIHGVALSSAISNSPHPETATRHIIESINREVQHVKNLG